MTALRSLRSFACGAVLFTATTAGAQTPPSSQPRLQISALQYSGAFRLPAAEFGSSSLNYSEGPFDYNAANNSVFIVGHAHHQQIAEFRVPAIVNSTNLSSLNISGNPLQTFVNVIGKAPSGNPQDINRIGGMRLIPGANGPELVVNGYQYYDAAGTVSHTTLVVRSPGALTTSTVGGFYSFAGGSGHTSGWISPIPAEWRTLLGGNYITGQSSGIPIISRTSVGPSAFAFNSSSLVGTSSVPNPIPTTKLLDFSLDNPLASDLSNDTRTNNLWTHLSRVTYGFIAPGTRTYITIGTSGGHSSGVCYKCTQDNGNVCGGFCSYVASDNHRFYWLWDVNDLVDVKEGRKTSHSVRPYAFGRFDGPFNSVTIGGASFDPASGRLYVALSAADNEQGTYSNPPVIAVYQVGAGSGGDNIPPAAPSILRVTN